LDRRRGREGGVTGRTRRRSQPMTELHRRLRTINIAGSGAPKTAGGGYVGAQPGKCSGHRPPDDGPGNHRLPPPVGHRWTIARGRWARETVGSGRVSGAMAHLSKSRRVARRRDAIADRMLGMRDHRPAVGRGRMMAVGTFDVCSNAAVNSDLSCFLYNCRGRVKRPFLHCQANSVA